MRNRAKCKICTLVVESFFQGDIVFCKCGEIAVMDGEALRTWSKDGKYSNFLRVDDEGNEIIVKYEEKNATKEPNNTPADPPKEVTKEELIEELDAFVKSVDNLPEHAKFAPCTNADLSYCMLLVSNIFWKCIKNME